MAVSGMVLHQIRMILVCWVGLGQNHSLRFVFLRLHESHRAMSTLDQPTWGIIAGVVPQEGKDSI